MSIFLFMDIVKFLYAVAQVLFLMDGFIQTVHIQHHQVRSVRHGVHGYQSHQMLIELY